MRVYSGKVSKGDFINNTSTNKRTRVPRLVRIHSDELEDIPSAVSMRLIEIVGGIQAILVVSNRFPCFMSFACALYKDYQATNIHHC